MNPFISPGIYHTSSLSLKKMLSLIAFLLIFLWCKGTEIPASTQQQIKELEEKLKATEDDLEKAKTIVTLISLYTPFDTTTAQQYLADIHQHEHAVRQLFYPYAQALYLIKRGKHQAASTLFRQSYSSFLKNKDYVFAAKSLSNLGACHSFIGKLDSALYCIRQSKNLIEKEKLSQSEPELYATTYSLMGTVFSKTGEHDSILYYTEKAIQIRKANNDPKWGIDLQNQAISYFNQGNINQAAKGFLRAAQQLEKNGDLQNAMAAYFNLASTHRSLQQYEEESEYIQKTINISSKLNDRYFQALGLLHLANNKVGLEEHNISKNLDLQALGLAYELGNDYLIARALYHLGEDYFRLNNRDSAEYHLKECRAFCTQSKASQVKLFNALAAKGLGELYIRYKQYQRAIPFLKEYIEWESQNRNSLVPQGEAYMLLAEAYAKIENYQQAYHSHQQYKILNDSILNEENIAAVAKAETAAQYQAEQERQAIALEAERKQQRLIQYSLIGGILALVVLLFLIYKNYRIKNQANQTIEAQKQQLEQLNKTKDHIFAIIGHDMRKPVLSFRGIAQKVNYLLKKQDFETLNGIGQEVEQNALTLNKLTDNLLNWALLQKEALTLNPTSILLAEVIEEIIELFKGAADNKNINIQTNIPEDLEVLTDLHAFRTIIRNLIDNAIKYTPENGQVNISASKIPTGVEIEVADTGVGIAEDKLQNIFLLQNDKSTRGTAGEKGTGLGMHLVKELTKINHGAIDVKSQVGKGTLFVLTFPS